MNHQTFVVIPTADLTEEFLEEFHQDSLDTVRKSVNGKLAILAFSGEKPSALLQHEAELGEIKLLTHDDALSLMDTKAWRRSGRLAHESRALKRYATYAAYAAGAVAAAAGAWAMVHFHLVHF